MQNNIDILITEQEISDKVKEIALQISKDFKGESVVAVGLLRGSFVFIADLVREIDLDICIDFMMVSSYGDDTESKEVRILKDLDENIYEKNVLLVEDIIDSGYTLEKILDILSSRKPKSITVCTLLDKPSRRKAHVDVRYCGFEVPDRFVIGYGLDYAQKYRNLPYIGLVRE